MAALTPTSKVILSGLRSLMKRKEYIKEPIQAYIVPSKDPHQNEYIAPCHKRRQFVSGFSGSAGTAVVTSDRALMWTDGRYFLQAENEMDSSWWLMKSGIRTQSNGLASKVIDFKIMLRKAKEENLKEGDRVGVDPFLISLDEWQRISRHLLQCKMHLVRIDTNLIDLIWKQYGIPQQKESPIIILDDSFTGKSWPSKVMDVQANIKKECKVDALVVTALDEIAWLFNLRGSDIDFCPVFYAYSIVTVGEAWLFVDSCRITPKVSKHLTTDKVKLNILPYKDISTVLIKLCSGNIKCLVSGRSSSAIASLIPVQNLIKKSSPITLMKAIKNKQEIDGMKNCHIKDGLAVCEFLSWLEKEVPKGNIDEVDAAERLEAIRREQEHFVGLSFETISAVGKHAAIIHFRPSKATALTLNENEIYLCDSGGHYLDGTTDVTRTVYFGTPSRHEMECFTCVLKGHIALASTVFPKGTKGHSLDVLARKALWDCGLNYRHGTGHGVGSFLNVHEGPHGITNRCTEEPPLTPGMIVTNEPGYYEDGSFGIRIENVMAVKDVNLKYNFENCGFLGFEALTLIPIQKKLIAMDMLNHQEIEWLNDYHEKCCNALRPILIENGKDDVLKWLIKETLAIPL